MTNTITLPNLPVFPRGIRSESDEHLCVQGR